MHADPRDALIQHLHTRRHLLQRQSPTVWDQASRPPEPGSAQETDTRARSSLAAMETPSQRAWRRARDLPNWRVVRYADLCRVPDYAEWQMDLDFRVLVPAAGAA